jgi:putative DNA primase/helicase
VALNGEKVDVRELAWTVASSLLEENHFVTFEDTDEIYRYEDGVYVPGGESYVARLVQRNVEQSSVSNHLILEVLGHIRRATYVRRSAFSQTNPHLVLQNCLLNLETMQPEPFSPKRYELAKMPVVYDPAKDCPTFKRFINEVLSPEDVLGVQEELGAIFLRRYLTKKFSIYLGETDTGKTTLVNVILALLDADNVSNVSIQQLGARDRFALAELFGKLANIRDDLSKDVIYSAGKIKELTGGFPVQAEHKFQNPFSFVNAAYMIFTCNVLPPIEEDDGAFFNRVIIRLFSRKFGGNAKPDRELVDKMTTPEELSGILNWGLEGLRRLRANGWSFTNSVSLETTREDYKRRSDPVWAFVQDCLEAYSEGAVSKERLYNSFKAYCDKRAIPLLSKDTFFKTLPEKVTVTSGHRILPGEGETKRHCFVGIRFQESSLDGEKGVPPVPPVPGTLEAAGKEQPEQPEQGSSNLRARSEPLFVCLICGAGPYRKDDKVLKEHKRLTKHSGLREAPP